MAASILHRPKIVSMVPSWTETLLMCGVDVVGRTRYCIHPEEVVGLVPVVGGTKDIQWQKLEALKADFLLLDREENKKEMAENSPIPVIETHVTSVHDMPQELEKLSQVLQNPQLKLLAQRWMTVLSKAHPLNQESKNLNDLPSVMEWVRKPNFQVDKFVYVIWKDPWMAVSKKTFIGSVFQHLGFGDRQIDFEKKYPEIQLKDFDPGSTLLLFSSEPFPFHKFKDLVQGLGFPCAIVDGEVYSWFGMRTLRFLEDQLGF